MVTTACYANKTCGTQFPGPLAMAASFNRTLWQLKGSVLGSEQRAFMNLHGTRGHDGGLVGMHAYGPNINILRDPRFGRASELPGEDPYLSGQYGAAKVRGLQERDQAGYPKVLAYLKHFTAYSEEANRQHNNLKISLFDLFDTYLPQYETSFREGNATGLMCAYNSINGQPACANGFLLQDVLREEWNRPMAHVTSDCRAVFNILGAPAWAPDNATAAAWALLNGTDIEMGSDVMTHSLKEAVEREMVTEERLNQAFLRSFLPHFTAGRFDDPRKSEWTTLGVDHIASEYHQQVQLEAALQGLVLLQNRNNVLPLQALGSTSQWPQNVAVLGPLGQTSFGLLSDYWGEQICPEGGFDCIPTLAESIGAMNPGITISAKGVDVDSLDKDGIHWALTLAQVSDVVVLCLGNTKDQERETRDRNGTALPGLQESFAQQVFAIGKPVIVVLVNGGQVAVDGLVHQADALIEMFNPNIIGGKALALTLFGKENRWGKLPYTIYPYEDMSAFDMSKYEMSKPPGRTYRYYTGKAVFPFGYGLSYTSFSIDCKSEILPLSSGPFLDIVCTVTNEGPMDGDEVAQVYHSPGEDIRRHVSHRHPLPLKRLVEFERVHARQGETVTVSFRIDLHRACSLVNEGGKKTMYNGTHKLFVTNGVQSAHSTSLWIDTARGFEATKVMSIV